MFPLLCDPRIYEFIDSSPPHSVDALAERYRALQTRHSTDGSERWLNWIIRLREGGSCVGFVQATLYTPTSGDVAYVTGSDYWGRGLAHEAASAMLRTLFEDYGLASLFAVTDSRNTNSRTLLTRLGFREMERLDYPRGETQMTDEVFQLQAAVAKEPPCRI